MRSSAIAVALATLLLAACSGHQVREPYPVPVEVEKPQKLPDELLEACPVHNQTGRAVADYTYTAIVNTAALRQCALQIEEIRKLQP